MAHQEVGHIVYYQSYKLQDAVFRSGANPGRLFIIALSVGLRFACKIFKVMFLKSNFCHFPSNLAFQDAFAKLVSLSISTPEHHRKVGFISAISKETGNFTFVRNVSNK